MKRNFDSDFVKYVESERYLDTPSNFARDNFLYVQETGTLKSLKPHMSKRSNIESFLIMYVISGEGTLGYENKRTKVDKNAFIFIDCLNEYFHESSEENPWELAWVHFNGKNAKHYYEYFTQSFGNIYYCNNQLIHNLFSTIKSNTQRKPDHYELVNNSLIIQLISTPPFDNDTEASKITIESSLSEKLEQVKNYLEENFPERITLEDLANEFFISKYYLSREFKKKYGIGVNTFVTNNRINYSKELLRFTEKSISTIAKDIGIDDANYFIKQFKKSENLTPLDFRNKW